MYVHICVHIYTRAHAFLYHIYINIDMYVYTRRYIHMYMYNHIYIYMYVCAHSHICSIRTLHSYIHTYIVHICTYVHIWSPNTSLIQLYKTLRRNPRSRAPTLGKGFNVPLHVGVRRGMVIEWNEKKEDIKNGTNERASMVSYARIGSFPPQGQSHIRTKNIRLRITALLLSRNAL